MSRSKPITFFVSGHLDLTEDEFKLHYAVRIRDAVERGDLFVVADAPGADTMAQNLIYELGGNALVFHIGERPRHNAGFCNLVAGLSDDKVRDRLMTKQSDRDIAWVRPGRENSGTAQNLRRRRRQRVIRSIAKVIANSISQKPFRQMCMCEREKYESVAKNIVGLYPKDPNASADIDYFCRRGDAAIERERKLRTALQKIVDMCNDRERYVARGPFALADIARIATDAINENTENIQGGSK
jgi:hypothetical protein